MKTLYCFIVGKSTLENKAFLCSRTLCGLMLVAMISSFASAQSRDSATPGINPDEYEYLKQLEIENLDEDTYIKHNNIYILDRENKPFVFKFSDGIERRVYLYKVLDNTDRKDLALLAVYYTPSNKKSINVCIPNPESDKSIWNLFIDDLKDQGELENGFLSCLSFTLSKELSAFVSAGFSETGSASAESDDYDFCFPAGSLISLANGRYKAIEDIVPGDKLLGFNPETHLAEEATVNSLKIHSSDADKTISISKAILAPVEELTASNTESYIAFVELEATGNHPVLTDRGKVTLENLIEGDILIRYDQFNDAFRKYRVYKMVKEYGRVKTVYNLAIEGNNYMVNDIVVLEK